MKRYIALICVLATLVTGCAARPSYPVDDAYHMETDDQYSLHAQGTFKNLAEGKEGYYFALTLKGNHFLFYTDKKTLQTLPVCGKPNCLHYQETDEERRKLCNAFFTGDSFYPTVLYNEGRLLIPVSKGTSGMGLESFSNDGSERKEILSPGGISNSLFMTAHRGYLYYVRSEYTEEMESSSCLYRRSLHQVNAKEELLFASPDAQTGDGLYNILGYGNNLYFSAMMTVEKRFYRLDLDSMEVSQIFDLPLEVTDAGYNLIPFQGGLVCQINHGIPGADMSHLPATRYRSDLQGEKVEKWQENTMNAFTADDRYLYEWLMPGLEDPEEGGYLRILDGEGKVVARCSLLEEVPDYMYLLVPQGGHVFIACKGNGKLYYFPKSEIETGQIHPKLLIDCTQYQ